MAGKEYDISGIQERSTAMTAIDKQELKKLLLKCWMTHDGMWFYHSMQEWGIEKTNKINKAAIQDRSRV